MYDTLHSPRRVSVRSHLSWWFGPGGCVDRRRMYKIAHQGAQPTLGAAAPQCPPRRHPLVAPAAMPGAVNQNEGGHFRHGTRLHRKISLRSRNAMSDDALNRGCCNSQNTVAVM